MRCAVPGFGEGAMAFASDVIKDPLMRKIVFALIVAVLPTWVAEQSNQPPKNWPKSRAVHSVSGNPCAEYGVGFVKIAGSDTCIKIGGSVSVEAGGSSRR